MTWNKNHIMVQFNFLTLGYDLNEICTLNSSMQNIQTSFVHIPKFMIKWLFVYWFYDALGEANNQTVFLMSLNLTEDNDDLKSIKKFEQEKRFLLVSRQAQKIYYDMIVTCTILFLLANSPFDISSFLLYKPTRYLHLSLICI